MRPETHQRKLDAWMKASDKVLADFDDRITYIEAVIEVLAKKKL